MLVGFGVFLLFMATDRHPITALLAGAIIMNLWGINIISITF